MINKIFKNVSGVDVIIYTSPRFLIKPIFSRKYLFFLSLLLSTLFLGSCKKEVGNAKENSNLGRNQASLLLETGPGAEEMMEFSESKSNPYTITNMQLALANLIKREDINCAANMFNIRATHKYVKFMPADSSEFINLLEDTNLILFDYPLDKQLLHAGTYYRDPTVPEGQPNFQWASIPINYILPIGVSHIILSELYLPEEDPLLVQHYETELDHCITALVEEAFKMTGNDFYQEDTINITGMNPNSPKGKWTPAGNIKMFDDFFSRNIALKGCKVRVNRWFETRERITDMNGNYNMGHKFRGPVNYSIKWERNDYEIRHEFVGQAYFNGPSRKGNWDLVIHGGYSRLYAIIHRACHRYYYEGEAAREFLREPPGRHITGRMTIGAFDWEGVHNADINFFRARPFGAPEIRIFKPSRDCREIFSTTIHELAHGAHWKMSSNRFDYAFCDDKVAESWARGVQWGITRLEYQGYRGAPTIMPDYTQLVVDLVDNRISEHLFLNEGFYITEGDSVENYTLRQIENSLIGQRTWIEWRNKIKNDHSNPTVHHVDALFNLWN